MMDPAPNPARVAPIIGEGGRRLGARRADDGEPIASAPRDGRWVLIWIEPVIEVGQRPEDGHWAVAQYLTAPNEGWTWWGLLGKPTRWVPVPENWSKDLSARGKGA